MNTPNHPKKERLTEGVDYVIEGRDDLSVVCKIIYISEKGKSYAKVQMQTMINIAKAWNTQQVGF